MKEKTNQDHRIIAKELDLYILDEKAGQEFGFQEVMTPILGSEYLYQTSGHLNHYQGSMFPAVSRNNETLYLRPMTCPHHCLIYQQKPRSYRDLPFRLCENSILHRYEASGGLKGLERPQFSENLLINSLNELELNYTVLKGEAAFYGPKLDLEIKAADGKDITIATIQLDFILPQKFGLNYIDKEQKLQTAVIIHQSPFGSYQLPCQLAILPFNEEEEIKNYCQKLAGELAEIGVRVKIFSKKKLKDRIRQMYRKKIPHYLVIGKEELKTKILKLVDAYQEGRMEELTERELVNKIQNYS
ncbi:1317_t:CDS:2 [Funneliformis geosporum]|uniref:threonine--tRNA ligase n=1 Tax=Funneliformis geosporum TaxID=1117311 RepID=A0A9W4WHC0_9GLOM|nr:1317_t:CDS:2 [Funneliformis geosporum]